MDDQEITRLLRQSELCGSLDPDELRGFQAVTKVLDLRSGDVVFRHETPGAELYLVLDGHVSIYRDDRVFETVGPLGFFGELALIEPGPRSASARALGRAVILEVHKDVADRYLFANRESRVAILRAVTRRLLRLTEVTQAAYFQANMLLHDMIHMLPSFLVVDLLSADFSSKDDRRPLIEHARATRETLEGMMRRALHEARGLGGAYHKTPLRLDDLAHAVVARDLALHPAAKRVNVTISSPKPVAPVLGNDVDLRRALVNLVVNAAEASPDGGKIEIEVTQESGRVRLSVRDFGSGIPAAVRSRIFEPRFTTKSNGHGLGLLSCRDIVEWRHGGKLSFTTEEGKGTTFVVEIPG